MNSEQFISYVMIQYLLAHRAKITPRSTNKCAKKWPPIKTALRLEPELFRLSRSHQNTNSLSFKDKQPHVTLLCVGH